MTAMRIQCTFVVVCATNATTGPTKITGAQERAFSICAVSLNITVVRIELAFVVIGAQNTRPRPTGLTRTRKRPVVVGTCCMHITIMCV